MGCRCEPLLVRGLLRLLVVVVAWRLVVTVVLGLVVLSGPTRLLAVREGGEHPR